MNQRKAGAFLSYINIGIQTLLGFVYVPLLLYYMGKSQYGLYQLMGSLIAYFGVMDFGLSVVVVRFYSKYKALCDSLKLENFLAFIQRAYGYITVMVLIIGSALYFFIDVIFSKGLTPSELTDAKYIYILLLLNIMITLLGMMYRSVITANERFVFLKGIETLQLCIQPAVVIAVMREWPSAFAMAAVMTVINLLLTAIRVYYCFFILRIHVKYHFFDLSLFQEAKKLAVSSFTVTIVDQVFWKTNQIILGALINTAAVAVYSISSLFYMGYMSLSTAISGVFLPKVTELVTQKVANRELSDLFIRIGRVQYLILALVLSGFMVLGREFIHLWAGPDFSDAYWITLLIIIPFTIDLIQNIGLSIMQARNTYGFRAKVYCGIGIFNLILAIPMASYYGGIGCAFASGLSMFIGNGIIMNWYYASVEKLDICRFWKEILSMSVGVLTVFCIGYAVNLWMGNGGRLLFAIKVFLYILLYAAVMRYAAMNDYEKGLLHFMRK